MKEAIGGTWLFGIVITFIVFFTTFISFSTNYSRTFKVKDEVITIIERHKGVNDNTISYINKKIKDMGYFNTGDCVDNSGEKYTVSEKYSYWNGFKVNSTKGTKNSTNSNYCIRRYLISAENAGPIGHPSAAYYQVVVFFELDWPIVGTLLSTRVEGETAIIHSFDDKASLFS
jgi:hypothetical protein